MGGIWSVQIIEVVKTKTSVGNGTEEDPVRTVVQYWDKEGKLIGTEDPIMSKVNPGHREKPNQSQ